MASLLDEEALHRLLVHAARWVQASLLDQPPPPSGAPEALKDLGGGVFVTLRYRAQLAGCIGYVEAPPPLEDTVRRAACAAALDDVRFPRLQPEQLDDVDVELSILSPVEPIQPAELEPGRHGAILKWRGRQGLLLPQVATEHGLGREGFLAALCEKSGVPPGTFDREDCELLAFTVRHRQGRLKDLVAEEGTS